MQEQWRTASSWQTEQRKRTTSEKVDGERLDATAPTQVDARMRRWDRKEEVRGREEQRLAVTFQQPYRSPQTRPPNISPVRRTLSVPEDLQESRSLLTHTHITHSQAGGWPCDHACSFIDMARHLFSERVSPKSAPRPPERWRVMENGLILSGLCGCRDEGGKEPCRQGGMNTSKWRRVETETNPNNDRESEQSASPCSGLETEKKKRALKEIRF